MDAENTLVEKARKRLIFALDVLDRMEAERYVKQLEGSVGCFKVGLELFVREGPEILKVIKDHSSADIFLDLKLHDIPATLSNALKSAATHEVKYVTIHLEEREALRKIPPEVKDAKLEVLAVTVLTSISPEDLERYTWFRMPWNLSREKQPQQMTLFKNMPFNKRFPIRQKHKLERLVIDRAMQAQVSGCAGVITSGEEIKLIRAFFGSDLKVVVPGIRPSWSAVAGDDQIRITTPWQAIDRGADMIVVGRPIRTAKDPKEAAERILDEISQSLQQK